MVSFSAHIDLDVDRHVGEIDRRILGGFAEHIGRLVYGGLFDPDNPLSDESGFRRDVLEALRVLAMPVMRYPGGNFVSAYDWRDGIGSKDRRRARPDFAWKSIEPNTFGVDEFLAWCQSLGTEPLMVTNLGTLGPKDAVELVEYCNLPGGTYWSDQRIANGHRSPYNVRLWGLGNEMDGPWQAGHVPADVYARRAFVASQLMKGLDPTIELVLAGSTVPAMPTYMEWDRIVLAECWDRVDYISGHHYSRNFADDSPAFLAEGVVIDRIIEDYAAVLRYVQALKKSRKAVHLAFDEWNVWYRMSGDVEDGWWRQAPALLEEVYDFQDALVVAQYLNSFIRHADVVKIACLAQVVNVIAPILTRTDGLLLQSTYYPFALIAQHARGVSLEPLTVCPTYDAGDHGEAPVLDAAAAFDAGGNRLSLFLVNRSAEGEVVVDVKLHGRKPVRVSDAQGLWGHELRATNSWERPDTVRPKAVKAKVEGDRLQIHLPPPSMAVVAVDVTNI